MSETSLNVSVSNGLGFGIPIEEVIRDIISFHSDPNVTEIRISVAHRRTEHLDGDTWESFNQEEYLREDGIYTPFTQGMDIRGEHDLTLADVLPSVDMDNVFQLNFCPPGEK